MRIRLALVASLGAATVCVTAAPAAQAATHQVRVEDNVFVPRVLQIQPGDTVAWTAARAQHTVTADDGRFDFHRSRGLDPGEQVSWRFERDETVRYYCRIHGGPGGQGMSGLIRVGEPPPAAVPAVPELIVPDDVATLRDAATGAKPGTRVLVRPGTYAEEVVVKVANLDIRGIGARAGDVVLDGAQEREVGITVAAPGVRISNLTVTGYRQAGIVVDAAPRTAVTDTVLRANGLRGLDARAPSGLTLLRLQVSGHGVAGIAVHDCEACGTRADSVRVEGNAAGIVAAAATGVIVRRSQVVGNAVGIVLHDSAGSSVLHNTITGNARTDVWVAAFGEDPVPPAGAGVWLRGGRANAVASNKVIGHTYGVVVTEAAIAHRVSGNEVVASHFADLGWDGLGAGVCFDGNHGPKDAEPTSDPPMAQTLYSCKGANVGVPYPVVTANLARHATEAGYPV